MTRIFGDDRCMLRGLPDVAGIFGNRFYLSVTVLVNMHDLVCLQYYFLSWIVLKIQYVYTSVVSGAFTVVVLVHYILVY